MSFRDDLSRFGVKVTTNSQAVFVNTVAAAKSSITDGSPITGAPGQPVDTGALKNSWVAEFESPTAALISTNVAYAPGIEDGVGPHGPITIRSSVGGAHSVRLTVLSLDRLVEGEARKVANG